MVFAAIRNKNAIQINSNKIQLPKRTQIEQNKYKTNEKNTITITISVINDVYTILFSQLLAQYKSYCGIYRQ